MSKFKINRCNILKNILINMGWEEADENDNIDFSYYDTYNNAKIKDATIMVIPRLLTNKIDNKNTMYTTLKKNNLTYFLPETYTDLKNIDKNIFNNNNIFFLKKIFSSGGKGVYIIKNYDEMKNIISNDEKNYILQKEVTNMLLYNGYKSTLRIYVLLTDKKEIYLYTDILGIIHSVKYSNNNSFDIHINHKNVKYYNLKNELYYSEIFNKIKDICFLTLKEFYLNDNIDKNRFIIFGFDFIIDNNKNPWLIEINQYPNLAAEKDTLRYNIKKDMIQDFVNIFLEPLINNKEVKQGKWCLCNPLHNINKLQETLKTEFEKNLFKKIQNNNYNTDSKIFLLNYGNKNEYNSSMCLKYLKSKYILILGNKLNFYNFLKKHNILYLTPKTYDNINNIEKNNTKIYYLKYIDGSHFMNNGIFFGNYDNIIKKYNEINSGKYIIQENVENPILFQGKKIIFAFYFFVFNNKIFYCKDSEYIAVHCENHNYGELPDKMKIKYNIIPFNTIKNYELIHKNIIQKVDILLKCYINELKDYNYEKYGSIGRMDIIVDNNNVPYILEVNNKQIHLTHNECYCCEPNRKNKLLKPSINCVDYKVSKDLFSFYNICNIIIHN